MASFTFSGLVTHPIFNELDSQGLLLALPRIDKERNAAYKHRLLDIYVNPSSSTQRGLLNSITRELGLSISDTLTVTNTLDNDGIPVLTFPATVFSETKCILYSDYPDTVTKTIERFDTDSTAWTLSGLAVEINAVNNFTAVIASGIAVQNRSMIIFDQDSVPIVVTESLAGKGHRVVLNNKNLVENTVAINSSNLVHKVTSEELVVESGDYYIDRQNGIVISFALPANGSVIRYQYRSDTTIFLSAPVILHNLQSNDFKTKMFEQTLDEDGTTVNSTPTILGADIINELLTVFPSNWGK